MGTTVEYSLSGRDLRFRSRFPLSSDVKEGNCLEHWNGSVWFGGGQVAINYL